MDNKQQPPISLPNNGVSNNALFNVLNNMAFFIMYIISFCYLFNKNTETIGFTLFFIVNTICGLTIINYDTFGIKSSMFIRLLCICSAIFTFIMTSIALFFVTYTLIDLRNKYQEKKTPYRLSDPNQQHLDDIKVRLAVLFPFTFLLLIGVFFFGDNCNIVDVDKDGLYHNVKCILNTNIWKSIKSVVNNRVSTSSVSIEGTIKSTSKFASLSLFFGMSITTIVLSSLNMYSSIQLAKTTGRLKL